MVVRHDQQLDFGRCSEAIKMKMRSALAALKEYEESLPARQQAHRDLMMETATTVTEDLEKREVIIRSKEEELLRLEEVLTAREKELVAGEARLRKGEDKLKTDQSILERARGSNNQSNYNATAAVRRRKQSASEEDLVVPDGRAEENEKVDRTYRSYAIAPVPASQFYRSPLRPVRSYRAGASIKELVSDSYKQQEGADSTLPAAKRSKSGSQPSSDIWTAFD